MIQVQTAHNVSLTLTPAGLGDRLIAHLLDRCIQGAYALLAVLIGALLTAQGVTLPTWAYLLFVGVPIGIYFPLFEILLDGQTPGKRMRKIRVIRLDGEAPSTGDYLLRWVLGFVDFTLSTGAVAVTAIALTERSQRLGDLAAGTTVVSASPRARLSDTVFEDVSAPDPLTYPDALRLEDADVRLIRDAISVIRVQGVTVQSKQVAEAVVDIVQSHYGIAPVDQRLYPFLRTLLHDYTILAGKADASFEPAA